VSAPFGAPYEISGLSSGQNAYSHTGLLHIVAPCNPATYRFFDAFDLLQYSMTRESLDAFTESESLPKVEGFQTGVASDPFLYHLSRAILPAIEHGTVPNQLFSDWFVTSILTRMVEKYGRSSTSLRQYSGGLSPANRRRVEEILNACPDGRIGLGYLARECGLSAGHFARVFRQTFGMPVHRYLLRIRIDRAKDLIHHSQYPLADIAQRIGFSDQATFTDCFSRVVGTSPGRYRRQVTAKAWRETNELVVGQA
jgi:AraC family transcriptional regulator